MQDKQNPYSNNSPYSVQNPYQSLNNDMSQQMQEQKRLENERRKQQYKFQCEESIDNIVHEFQSAESNQLESWKLNAGDEATVVRYFKRYWDNKFISLSFFIIVVTFILSFYTEYAFYGIFCVFLAREAYAQRVFLTYMLNDHELSRKQITEIKDKIFYKQLKTMITLALTLFLIGVSFISYLYSFSIFIEPQAHQKIIEILSKISPFHAENELFAYTNIGAILVLLLLKTYEKWSK
jgi:hypothetical protein